MKKPTAKDAIECTNLLSAIAQTFRTMSEQELDEHIKASGKDPKQVVARTKSLIADAVATSKKAKLRQARSALNAQRKEAAACFHSSLPQDPSLQRGLLDHLMQRNVQLPQPLTMAFRDRTSLSDSDLDSILRDLERLGFLSDLL